MALPEPSTTMHARHIACALALIAGTLASQSQVGAALTGELAPVYPTDIDTAEIVPFVTGTPPVGRRLGPSAAGAADLDGDRNRDLWFLGGDEIAVQIANPASLGRFVRRTSLTKSPFRLAATYRSKSTPVDEILAIDPASDDPTLLHWNPNTTKGDPRDGYLGGSVTGWKLGKGVTAIACADHSGDGHDDIIAFHPGPNGATAITKLAMGTQKSSFLWIEEKLTLALPTRLEKLRLLDIDGNRRTDFVAYSPGLGVVAVCDDPKKGFLIATFWSTQGLVVNDLATGDLDGNGLDDIVICAGGGMLVMQTKRTNGALHWQPRVFVNPTGVGTLATGRIVDADGSGTRLLLGFPRDGRNFVVHPNDPVGLGIAGPLVQQAPSALTGQGTIGESLIVTDVDNDADPDFVLQAPDGIRWLTLRNPQVSFAFTALRDVDKGPAPSTEGPKSRRVEVTVDVPRALIDAGVRFAEFAVYAQDPSTAKQTRPDYVYFGRLTPAIDTTRGTASVSMFYDHDESTWDQRVRDYQRKRAANISTFFDVYPKGQKETIRCGPRTFLSLHGLDGSKRFESRNGIDPPKPQGSTLSARWVLIAKPPTPTADLDLLPWE